MRSAPLWMLALGLALASCVGPSVRSDPVPDAPAATRETRTGVPLLMDLPGIGFLFGRRTVVR